jgi:hypothetical protein
MVMDSIGIRSKYAKIQKTQTSNIRKSQKKM